jgi:hypothetical protein
VLRRQDLGELFEALGREELAADRLGAGRRRLSLGNDSRG